MEVWIGMFVLIQSLFLYPFGFYNTMDKGYIMLFKLVGMQIQFSLENSWWHHIYWLHIQKSD